MLSSLAALNQKKSLFAADLESHDLGNIGIQLYTVRDIMKESVSNTLQSIAEIGYKEVEFAGYFGKTPSQIKSILSANNLHSPSTHIEIQLLRDYPNQVIEAALEVGHEFIVMAFLDPSERINIDQYRAHADLFNSFGERCKKHGLRFAFHNHDFDFQVLNNSVPMDILLEETNPDLVSFELDLYWATKANVDPIKYIRDYPGRFPLWHVKDMQSNTKMADVGDGVINFSEIFKYNEVAGLEHYYVERDDPPNSLKTASRSYDAMLELNF